MEIGSLIWKIFKEILINKVTKYRKIRSNKIKIKRLKKIKHKRYNNKINKVKTTAQLKIK